MLIAACDLETTGFKADKGHRIVEICLQLWDTTTRQKVRELNTLINPLRDIPADASRVNGIYIEDLHHAPTWDKIAPLASVMLSKAKLFVAHNATFDGTFLTHELVRLGMPAPQVQMFCTMQNSRAWATATGKSPKLAELCFTAGVEYDPALAHRATYDVDRMMACLWKGVDAGGFYLPQPYQEAA